MSATTGEDMSRSVLLVSGPCNGLLLHPDRPLVGNYIAVAVEGWGRAMYRRETPSVYRMHHLETND